MNYRELAEISQAQIKALMQTNESLQLMLHSQSATLKTQSAIIQSLSEEIKQLKEILLVKDKSTEKIVNKVNGLSKITFSTKTEKRKLEQTSDNYLHFDETYHTFIDNRCENGSRKGYFWAALSSATNLIHIFTADGSRAKKVFTDYLPTTYSGAIQTDGYSSYKVIEGWTYSKAIRLGCIQHCKRKFIEIEQQKEAKEIIDIYNEFYHLRNTTKKENWVDASLKVYDKLKRKLRELEKDKMIICNSILSKAVAYSLNELDSIRNIIISTDYDLDNNQIERPMRYISISRKNSMFCGSGKSAARLALIYSLAISCRLNGVNSFEYFCDIINRLAELPPNISNEKLRELLPDKWGELK